MQLIVVRISKALYTLVLRERECFVRQQKKLSLLRD